MSGALGLLVSGFLWGCLLAALLCAFDAYLISIVRRRK
jgi:hypothetical protein